MIVMGEEGRERKGSMLFVVTFCDNDSPFQFNILGHYIPSHSSSSLTRLGGRMGKNNPFFPKN